MWLKCLNEQRVIQFQKGGKEQAVMVRYSHRSLLEGTELVLCLRRHDVQRRLGECDIEVRNGSTDSRGSTEMKE